MVKLNLWKVVMKDSEMKFQIKVSTAILSAILLLMFLTGCGNTMSGFKTDIDSKRQAMSDFINPTLSSDEVEEEE